MRQFSQHEFQQKIIEQIVSLRCNNKHRAIKLLLGRKRAHLKRQGYKADLAWQIVQDAYDMAGITL